MDLISLFTNQILDFLTVDVREPVKKKLAFLADADAKGGGGGLPPAAKKWKFLKIKKKCLDCSETKEYAEIFLQEYPLTTWKFFKILFFF